MGEAAERTGWSARMLRYLESVGLVVPRRTPAGYRLYGEAALRQLNELRELRARFGLELGDAGQRILNAEVIGPGAAFRYRPGTVHRVTALEDTTILEVSTPELDDVVRLEDLYGREGSSEA